MAHEDLRVKIERLVPFAGGRWTRDQLGGHLELLPQDLGLRPVDDRANAAGKPVNEVSCLQHQVLVRGIEPEEKITLQPINQIPKTSFST